MAAADADAGVLAVSSFENDFLDANDVKRFGVEQKELLTGDLDGGFFCTGRIFGGDGIKLLSALSASSDEAESIRSFLRLDLTLTSLCGDLAVGLTRFRLDPSAALEMSEVRLSFSHLEAASM